jgi:hypothetical protein
MIACMCKILVVHWIITAAVTMSTYFLVLVLDDMASTEKTTQHSFFSRFTYTSLFCIIVISLSVLIPMWKQYIAQFKVLILGPWDIPTKASMNLDYMIQSTVASN